ncbi:MAG: ABC transporter substrate-binding protein [Promethearchaeota archaeon]
MKKKITNSILLIFLLLSLIFPIIRNYTNYNSKDAQERNKNPVISDVTVGNYLIPGISVAIPLSQVIKIGILNDMGEISGDHSWNGAYLAAKEINQAGGVVINSITYYVGLVAEDTDETDPNLIISEGIIAAENMVNNHDPHYIIGGYRTEALLAYQEIIMDAKIPFLSTGVSTDIFCENVRDNYARYKYFFRVLPLNSTSSAAQLITYYAGLVAVLNATYGFSNIKFGILCEDLAQWDSLQSALQVYLPILIPGSSILPPIRFDVTLSETDMATHLASLDVLGAQIVIPLISGQNGILMGRQYGNLKPQYLLTGINHYATYNNYWDLTQGGGRYEIVMQEVYRTNKTENTIPFWDNYVSEFGVEPFYTGTASYDAVKMLVNSSVGTQSFTADTIVQSLENFTISDPFPGASGNIAFWRTHDLVRGFPYGYNLFCQWQMDGKKEVIPSWGIVYPQSIVTGSLSIPYWGIQNMVEDFSDELPGDFTLSSDADNPDKDGTFNLSWTTSDGADSYSLYVSDEPITYISKTQTQLIDNNSISPYSISDLKTGDYYFAVVSYNGTGQKFSNSLHITVELPRPGVFTLTSNAGYPDIDGMFDLSWTASDGADNYSIYIYDKFISEFNESLTNLADQDALSPFSISGWPDGVHYFVVIAYNATGERMSNCISITVDRPKPGDFTLTSNADNPDADGVFDLIWTSSENALNYSVYIDYKPILEINESSILLAEGITALSYPLSGFTDGRYYFIVEAWNENGTAVSNSISVDIYNLGDVVSLFDGLFLNQSWIMGGFPYNISFTYSHLLGDTYNTVVNFDLGYSSQYTVDRLTREVCDVRGMPIDLNNSHTNRWIYPNTELGDYYLISVDGAGDRLFQVIGEDNGLFPGFGVLEYWMLIDITGNEGFAIYEKNSGINLAFNFTYGVWNSTTWYAGTLNATNVFGAPILPGPFTLSSTAGSPDDDGIFDLTWSSSSSADNYTVYEYNQYISVINGSLTVLADETPDLNLPLSGYSTGNYYFIVVAHNEYGDMLSNCIQVVIISNAPGPFLLLTTAQNPDEDGEFDLVWTSSSGTDTYSVFEYKFFITEINGSLTLLKAGLTDLSLALSSYDNGTYYFIVSAHNANGYTLSNCVLVTVAIPPKKSGGPSIPGYQLCFTIGILGISLSYLLRKSRKQQFLKSI